jgi:hypothetical protein
MHFLVRACDINMRVRSKASVMHLNQSSDVIGSVEDQCAPNNVSQALKSASVGAIGLQKQLTQPEKMFRTVPLLLPYQRASQAHKCACLKWPHVNSQQKRF